MKEIAISDKCSIQVYSSIKELPIELSKKFNAFLLQDAGIGNSMEDVDDHLTKIMQFVGHDMKTEATEELKNLRYNLFSMLSNWNYKSAAFGCLISKVDGVSVEDYSSEGLSLLIAKLSEQGLTEGKVQEIVEEVKKNLIPNVNFSSRSTLEPI